MRPRRRQMIGGLAALLALPAARPAEARTDDLVVLCDKALGPPLLAVARAYRARTGVRIVVFPTSPGLILPQLRREVQNDIVATDTASLDIAARDGIVAPGGPAGRWRNRLVVATGAAATAPFAVPDAPIAAGVDGRAVLAAAGIRPATLAGVLDTAAVADALNAGTAGAGLLTLADARANPALRVGPAIADGLYPPLVYGAAVTKLSRRGDPASFMAFLASPPALALLTAGGLEISA